MLFYVQSRLASDNIRARVVLFLQVVYMAAELEVLWQDLPFPQQRVELLFFFFLSLPQTAVGQPFFYSLGLGHLSTNILHSVCFVLELTWFQLVLIIQDWFQPSPQPLAPIYVFVGFPCFSFCFDPPQVTAIKIKFNSMCEGTFHSLMSAWIKYVLCC